MITGSTIQITESTLQKIIREEIKSVAKMTTENKDDWSAIFTKFGFYPKSSRIKTIKNELADLMATAEYLKVKNNLFTTKENFEIAREEYKRERKPMVFGPSGEPVNDADKLLLQNLKRAVNQTVKKMQQAITTFEKSNVVKQIQELEDEKDEIDGIPKHLHITKIRKNIAEANT